MVDEIVKRFLPFVALVLVLVAIFVFVMAAPYLW